MWNERYSTQDYVYGKLPNDFLKEVSVKLTRGRTLCLAEGEGRNAVFLATLGHDVLAVDLSIVGLNKAQALATEHCVEIQTEVADLAGYDLGESKWDTIVSIFCHLPPEVRKRLHSQIAKALVPGGVFVLEAYTPDQLGFGTGGPPVAEMMMSLEALKDELSGLYFEHAVEIERDVCEGFFHTGRGAVVRLLARKVSRSGLEEQP